MQNLGEGGIEESPVITEQESFEAGTARLFVEYTCSLAEWDIHVCKSLDKGQNVDLLMNIHKKQKLVLNPANKTDGPNLLLHNKHISDFLAL